MTITADRLVGLVWLDVNTGEPAAPVTCPSWCTHCETESDGSTYHGSDVEILDLVDEGGKVTEAWVSAHRLDDEDGTQSPTSVTVTFRHDGFDLTPANARELGALLIATADLIEGVTS